MASFAATALTIQHKVYASPAASEFSLALLSDSHIAADPANEYRGFRPTENLAKVIAQVVQSPSQHALLCGDAARLEGKADDYQQLKKLLVPLQSKMSIEIALGNHDDRANFWSVFGKPDSNSPLAGKKHVTVADLGPQRWIVLDSLMYVDKVPGFLGTDQRGWLKKLLEQEQAKPVFLMVHHTLGEGDGDLLDTERLLSIAHAFPQVKGIVFGHSHRWSIEKKNSLWWINLPAIGYNFGEDQPVGWVQAQLSPSELKLTLQAIGGNQRDHLKTQTLTWGNAT
jgi:3',5'-cyclic AMP phosphodiesterase CpdA